MTPSHLGSRPGAAGTGEDWLSTEVAAQVIGGVTPRWVRMQIEAGRLQARVLLTGRRPTYRIRFGELERFLARYVLDDAWSLDGLDSETRPGRG